MIVVVPAATPVTGMGILVALVGNVIDAGTVATPGLLEFRLTVSPADAGPERFSVRVPMEPAAKVKLPGENELLPTPPPVTATPADVLVIPVALAVMVAGPAATPVTGTITLAVPAAIVAVDCTEATPGLLELKLTFKPPAGATPPDRFSVRFPAEPILIARLAGEKLMPSVTLEPTTICPVEEG
jgi:hypothetical protein